VPPNLRRPCSYMMMTGLCMVPCCRGLPIRRAACSFSNITKRRYECSYRSLMRIVYVPAPPRRAVRSPAEAIPWVPRRGAPCHGMR
jgi:hypothetical protein